MEPRPRRGAEPEAAGRQLPRLPAAALPRAQSPRRLSLTLPPRSRSMPPSPSLSTKATPVLRNGPTSLTPSAPRPAPPSHALAQPSQRLRPLPMVSYDLSMMETAMLGPRRPNVAQVQAMAEEQCTQDTSGSATSSESEDCDEGDQDLGEELDSSGAEGSSWVPGLYQWNQELYNWVASRMGTRTKLILVLSFVALEASRSYLEGVAYVEGINYFSILVTTNMTSLLFALWVSMLMEGDKVMKKLLRWEPIVRFMGISFLFTFAHVLILLAYRIHTPNAEVVTVGYIYMPLSAIVSSYVFRRKYGTLEWVSVGMMTLAVLSFVLLREESRQVSEGFGVIGFVLVVFSVGISVSASIMAERVLKEQDWCVMHYTPRRRSTETAFYIIKVHLDLCALGVSVSLWFSRTVLPHIFEDFFEQWSKTKSWFGSWGRDQFLMVIVAAAHGWAAGLMTKEFSTVIKAIVQTLSVVGAMLIGDPLQGNLFHFQARELPSILLGLILLMSALVFQTGRINFKVLRKVANIDAEAHPDFDMDALAEPEGGARHMSRSSSSGKYMDLKDIPTNEEQEEQERKKQQDHKLLWQDWKKLCTTYALILVYIISDAGRTIVLQKSLQSTVINSTSMGLVCYVCGAVVASGLSLYTHGFRGLLLAWNPRKILHCLPAAFLFALATALANMSFAQGITSALFVVLGKFYTPVAALGARWIMGKFYMWLEWFALLILTLASVVFGYLQAVNIKTGVASGAPMCAMLLVLGSAATSALASLVTEKILKGEQVPFHMQKVRLDVGSIFSSLVLLPVLGRIATRPQDIPWAQRPWDVLSCPKDSVCWDMDRLGCASEDCSCECTSGIFAGWNSPVLLLAVAINTTQGWLVGKVTQQFSVIHRAIADSFSLLAIYFIGDPIFNHTSLGNVGLNLVAFIVPLSTATFSVATSEMQKVFNAKKLLKQRKDPNASLSDDTDSNESDLDTAPGSKGMTPHSRASSSPSPMMGEFRSATDGAWLA